jgi:hypothetical protein
LIVENTQTRNLRSSEITVANIYPKSWYVYLLALVLLVLLPTDFGAAECTRAKAPRPRADLNAAVEMPGAAAAQIRALRGKAAERARARKHRTVYPYTATQWTALLNPGAYMISFGFHPIIVNKRFEGLLEGASCFRFHICCCHSASLCFTTSSVISC